MTEKHRSHGAREKTQTIECEIGRPTTHHVPNPTIANPVTETGGQKQPVRI
jgi:hypothetical protein